MLEGQLIDSHLKDGFIVFAISIFPRRQPSLSLDTQASDSISINTLICQYRAHVSTCVRDSELYRIDRTQMSALG